jgi:hypothetical protein
MNRHESEEEVSLTDKPLGNFPCCKRLEQRIVDHFITHRREYEENFIIGGWILLIFCSLIICSIILYFCINSISSYLYSK